MTNLDDIIEIASSLNNALLIRGKDKNFKDNIAVNIALDELELHGIDRELYVMKNKEANGFNPASEVDAKILGIRFVLTTSAS